MSKDNRSLESKYNYMMGLGFGMLMSGLAFLPMRSGSVSIYIFWIVIGTVLFFGGLYGSNISNGSKK